MAQRFPVPPSQEELDDPLYRPYRESTASRPRLSLGIILISAVVGIGSGLFGLYVAYELLYLIAPVSAALATLCLIGGISLTATLLSALTGTRSVLLNIGFSCGLTVFVLGFLGLCLAVGALVATWALT